MLKLATCVSRLRDKRGVAAIEFAIGAPIFVLLLLLGFDVTRYAIATRRLEAVASTVGQMVSVSASGQIAPADLQFYKDSAMVIFPQVLQDSFRKGISWSNDLAITVSSIVFTGVSPVFVGTTKWSAGPSLRACIVPMLPTSDTAPPSPQALPQDTFGAGTLIVVDVVFTFRPTVASAFLQSIPIARSFYVQPRYVSSIAYSGTQGTGVNQC